MHIAFTEHVWERESILEIFLSCGITSILTVQSDIAKSRWNIPGSKIFQNTNGQTRILNNGIPQITTNEPNWCYIYASQMA